MFKGKMKKTLARMAELEISKHKHTFHGGCRFVVEGEILYIFGTDHWSDFKYSLNASTVDFMDGSVHEGFLEHATEVEEAVGNFAGIKHIFGHSLGATAAVILGMKHGIDVVAVACPRLFNRMPKCEIEIVHFAARKDYVHRLPMWLKRPPGERVMVGKDWKNWLSKSITVWGITTAFLPIVSWTIGGWIFKKLTKEHYISSYVENFPA